MTANTPEDRKRLAAERAATRQRVRATKLAAKALAAWLDPALAQNETKRAVAGERWLARLGDENIRRLAMRMRRMADWEMARAEQMRDAGASPWTLLKYLGASQDMVIDGPACRDTIYAETLQYSNARKQQRGRETLIKAAIPLAVIATTATLVSAGVGYVASVAGPFVGMDPVFAADCWQNWQNVFSPVLTKAKAMVVDFDIASAGAMFALGAFWMWAHDSRVAEDLRARAAEKEVPTLEQGIGFAAKSHRIQSAIRSIPESQRILLSHLSSTDLRAFLLSTDDERIHMLRENRPPLINQFKAILAAHPRTVKSILPAIRDIADVCLPKRWARAAGATHPGEINQQMMSTWRAPSSSLEAVDKLDIQQAKTRRNLAATQSAADQSLAPPPAATRPRLG